MLKGVNLVEGKIKIRFIAAEPNASSGLSWFDFNNEDDRILASLIEVMRSMPRSKVILMTGDINLQNKAEMAGLPYIEPPLGI